MCVALSLFFFFSTSSSGEYHTKVQRILAKNSAWYPTFVNYQKCLRQQLRSPTLGDADYIGVNRIGITHHMRGGEAVVKRGYSTEWTMGYCAGPSCFWKAAEGVARKAEVMIYGAGPSCDFGETGTRARSFSTLSCSPVGC